VPRGRSFQPGSERGPVPDPRARRTTIALLGWALLPLGSSACDVVVRTGLSEAEANQLVVALDQAALVATKRAATGSGDPSDRYAVTVASSEATQAMRLLEAQGLPRAVQPGFDALFRETSVLATPGEERSRLIAASAGELSRSLEHFPGVLTARVHVAVPDPQIAVDAKPVPMTAAVLLQRRSGSAALAEAPVRELVASAIDGLDPSRVTIVQVAALSAEAGPPRFTRLGPFTVSAGSAAGLRSVLGGALALDLMLALALIALVRQRRRTPPELDHTNRNRPRVPRE
jgi:type III secretion protein J